MIPISEKNVQQAVSDYLTARRIVHWRQNSGVYIGEHTNKKGRYKRRFVRFMYWLWPRSTKYKEYAFLDIGGILPDGRYFTAEAKKPGKEPSDEQWNTIYMIRDETNAVVFWFDSIDTFIGQFEGILNTKQKEI